MPPAAETTPTQCKAGELDSEAGLTLVELLVAIAIFTIVGFGGVSLLMSATGNQAKITDRARKTADTRIALERIVRELRQGVSVVSSSGSSVVVSVYLHTNCTGTSSSTTANLCRVSYSCVSGTCSRTASNTDGTGAGTAKKVITGINNSTSVFTVSGSPATYVGVTFSVTPKNGKGNITLQDGATLRGATLGL